jgi:hypothetical protein
MMSVRVDDFEPIHAMHSRVEVALTARGLLLLSELLLIFAPPSF